MTQEQYERAKPLEGILKSAINSNYIRLMDRITQNEFISLCKELNIHINPNCPSCVLNAAIRLGKIYLSYVPEINSDNAREHESSLDNKTIKPTLTEPSESPDSSDSVSDLSDLKDLNDLSDLKPKKQRTKSTKKK